HRDEHVLEQRWSAVQESDRGGAEDVVDAAPCTESSRLQALLDLGLAEAADAPERPTHRRLQRAVLEDDDAGEERKDDSPFRLVFGKERRSGDQTDRGRGD